MPAYSSLCCPPVTTIVTRPSTSNADTSVATPATPCKPVNPRRHQKDQHFLWQQPHRRIRPRSRSGLPHAHRPPPRLLHLPYKIINAGISGETTAGGESRLNWTLRQPADIFVLELGANDGLRGIPVNSTRDNLQSIIDTVRHRYPARKIILAGMRVPQSMGSTYSSAFHDIFTQLAHSNDISLIPFLLDGVGGDPSLNQPDGIHPNYTGEKIVTETVWQALRPLL